MKRLLACLVVMLFCTAVVKYPPPAPPRRFHFVPASVAHWRMACVAAAVHRRGPRWQDLQGQHLPQGHPEVHAPGEDKTCPRPPVTVCRYFFIFSFFFFFRFFTVQTVAGTFSLVIAAKTKQTFCWFEKQAAGSKHNDKKSN